MTFKTGARGDGADRPRRSRQRARRRVSHWNLGRYDSLYVPPKGQTVEVTPGPAGCDLAELAAPVDGEYPPAFVPYEQLKPRSGAALPRRRSGSSRELNILVGKNVEAGRLLAGVTFS